MTRRELLQAGGLALAEPWDSDFLVKPGDHFEVTLTAEGVYDYFCAPHEAAGMVGRIVVSRPSGPGTVRLLPVQTRSRRLEAGAAGRPEGIPER